ncbi:hypothetical protein CVIRNUC_007552 [Coccomyxa viridis]|uniref:Uncharacterized protein n=1 Tax=Coccomyxa viridis TaxID=1274662 RepID=A0AAV1IEN7_9CHLO|nr:hypothetical protein CVIRNUC_007552 [Coccomyxa viridis]
MPLLGPGTPLDAEQETAVSVAELSEDGRAPQAFGTCALWMLAEGLQSARLETRTKEYNVHASWWASSPTKRKQPDPEGVGVVTQPAA